MIDYYRLETSQSRLETARKVGGVFY